MGKSVILGRKIGMSQIFDESGRFQPVTVVEAGPCFVVQVKTKEKTEFFPLEAVKPGMRAIGYTVFEGAEPAPFEVEILGVLKGFPNPQQSAILTKLIGEKVEHTGVFQGMSGSPVYIDGKLLGAVAFGYQFAKDPIAGITPSAGSLRICSTCSGVRRLRSRYSSRNARPTPISRPNTRPFRALRL